MATAMVSLGIATGFERRYGVLKRLGSTPLSRGGLLVAKTTTVLALEVIQFVLVLAVGVALGWNLRAGVFPALGLLLLGTIAFAGIGMLMAGTLRAEANLAASNALFLVLLFLGGMAYPLDKLPAGHRSGRQAVAGRRALGDRARGADIDAVPDRRARRARRLGHRGTVARGPLLPLGRVTDPVLVVVCEQGVQRLVERALRRDAVHAVLHHAVAVDEPRLRDTGDAVAVTDRCRRCRTARDRSRRGGR